jgi:hypothetical protein
MVVLVNFYESGVCIHIFSGQYPSGRLSVGLVMVGVQTRVRAKAVWFGQEYSPDSSDTPALREDVPPGYLLPWCEDQEEIPWCALPLQFLPLDHSGN